MLKHLNAVPKLPPRVVVIGAGGFVGDSVCTRLIQRNAAVLGITRRNVDLLASDAAEVLAGMLRPDDAVLTVAAQAPCKSAQMLADNMKMVAAMIKALANVPLSHVVNISSDAVYADSPVPLTEDAILAPDTLHGVMHLAREIAFRSELKAPLATVRPSLLYGAGDPHNGYGPNRFRRLVNDGKDIVLFGKGEERRDHVHIDDVAELITRVLEMRSVGSLNIATGEVHSFRQIAEVVVASAPCSVTIQESPRQGPMPHNGFRPFDVSACRAAFPDFSYTPLAAGIIRSQVEEFGAGNA